MKINYTPVKKVIIHDRNFINRFLIVFGGNIDLANKRIDFLIGKPCVSDFIYVKNYYKKLGFKEVNFYGRDFRKNKRYY